jgi:hypothetical protein
MERIRRHMSFANVISVMALFVALGGASYAAVTLPKNSVGAKQIKKNGVGASEIKRSAVRTGEVRNGTLRAQDFAAGQLPQGPKGDPGQNGAPGEDAFALDAFARVGFDGADATLRPLEPNDAGQAPQVKGIVQADVVAGEGGAATGTTCFNLPTRPASAMVVVDNADAGTNVDRIASVAIDRGEDLGDCPGTHNDARVRIIDTDLAAGGAEQDPGPANARFFVWFEL